MNWIKRENPSQDVTGSILADEKSFYHLFTQDLSKAKQEVIIESPFITVPRLATLKPILERLIQKGVEVFIVTRYPQEHEDFMIEQAEAGIRYFEALGGQILLCEGHHRKLAFIDRNIVWKGSLNILSQTHSREFMEREENKEKAQTLFKFLKYNQVKFFRKSLI